MRIIDIRYTAMMPGDELIDYRLPTGAFLYAVQGAARVVLDGTVHEAGHFHVLHGSGGAYLDILSAGTGFHYFLLLYKAALISSGRAELAMRMEESNPTQAVLPGLNPTSVWVLSGGEMGVNLIFVQRNHLVCPLYQWGNRFKLFIDNENRYH